MKFSLLPKRIPRHWTIRNALLTLVLACLLPGAIGSAVLMAQLYRDSQTQLENRTIQTAHALGQTLDRQLLQAQAVAQTLSLSMALDNGDLARFHKQARDALALTTLGVNVVLSDTSGQQLVNTLQPFGKPLPRHGNPELIRQIMASGQPAISDLYMGGLLHRPVISVGVPVMRQGKVTAVLNIGLLPEQFNSLLLAQDLPPGWVATIVDRSGTIVGRSRAAEQIVGQQVNSALMKGINLSTDGVVESTLNDGVEAVFIFSRSPITGWLVGISIPRAELQAQQLRVISKVALGGVALLGMALGLAWLMGRWIATSVKGLVAPAMALGSGKSVAVPTLRIQEAAEVATALAQASEWLKERSALTQARDEADAAYAALQHEIALRDQAEGLLRQLQQKLSHFINGAPVSIAMFDRDMRYLAVSRRFLEDHHLIDIDVIGRVHYEVFPDMPQAWRDAHRRGLAGETLRCEQEALVRKDGSVWWLRWEINPWYAGANEIGGIILYTEDISERIRAEETIRQQTAELDMLYAKAPIGLTFFDKDLRYLRVNNFVAEMNGLTPAQHIGKTLYEVLAPALADAVEPLFRQVVLTGQPLLEQEFHGAPAARPDEPRDWLVSYFPVLDQNGASIGVQGVVQDVTERKQAKAALRDARLEAERANLAKSVFLAAASHDLRQPLTALSLYVSLLESKLGADDMVVLNMSNCVDSLSALLTDLLDLSKLQAGVVKPVITDFAVADLLERLASAHGPQAKVKNLQLRCRASKLTAHTDPVLYGRILDNFVSNAVRYTRQGGVLVGCRRHQGKTWIEVRDTGIGFAADKTQDIFEEFHQLDNVARGQDKGSGLGLSIAAKTAALLGLQIRVRSVLGRGSIFAIELPLGDAPASVKAVEPGVSHRLRIALVDDNEMVLDSLAYALEGLGHEVVAAPCGKDLLANLDGRAPDVVVSDFRLAYDETGFDVIQSLRGVFGDTLPAIVITGDTDPNLLRSMADQGILVQHKPLKLDSLLAAIWGLVSK